MKRNVHYHEWLLLQMAKEKTMKNQGELPLPPSSGDLPLDCPIAAKTSCNGCDIVMIQFDMVILDGEHYCASCANEAAVEKLRRRGL